MGMEGEDEKDKETYVVGAFGIVRTTWRMGWLQDECCCRHLRAQEISQDNTRRGEDISLSHSLTNLVEILYSQNSTSNLLFQRPKHPFYIREGRSQMYKREGDFEGYFLVPSKLAPKP